MSNPHLINGDFQSDKYPTTPLGKVPLSTKDPMAQDLLAEYARRRRAVDADFSDAVEIALAGHGYKAGPTWSPTPKEWDGRSIGESAPHAAYCDVALQDAQIEITDKGERIWSYDDALFDKSLAGNGYKIVRIDTPEMEIPAFLRPQAKA